MGRPLVSAIMPVYNGEQFLEQALESLLGQSYMPFEGVICDDGSTDRTPEILASYPSLRVVRQENQGPPVARNAAVAASKGELVAFFDADDTWPADRLSVQAQHLIDHPEVGCVLGRQEWVNPPPWLTRDKVYGDLDGIPLMSAMVRRTVMDELGGFDPTLRLHDDTDLLFRMREKRIEIAVLPDVVLYRRFHEDSVSADRLPPVGVVRSLRAKLEREREREREEAEERSPDGDGRQP